MSLPPHLRRAAPAAGSPARSGAWPPRHVGFLLACAALVACDGIGVDTLHDIERNRLRWERQAMRSYRFAVQRSCFCGPGAMGPARVTVVDGVVTSRTYVESGEAVPEMLAELFPTVDGIFAILVDAAERDAFRMTMTFDPDTGVPLEGC